MSKDEGGHGSERRLDHGELNVPLAKRMKGFHAELDRYKRDQKAEFERTGKELRKQGRDATKTALGILSSLPDSRLAELGKPHGLSVAGTRKMLESSIRSRPDMGLKAMQRETLRPKDT